MNLFYYFSTSLLHFYKLKHAWLLRSRVMAYNYYRHLNAKAVVACLFLSVFYHTSVAWTKHIYKISVKEKETSETFMRCMRVFIFCDFWRVLLAPAGMYYLHSSCIIPNLYDFKGMSKYHDTTNITTFPYIYQNQIKMKIQCLEALSKLIFYK